MKRYFTIVLIALMTGLATYADDYRPLVEDGKVWHMHHEVDRAFPNCTYDFDYFIQGDTLINGIAAKKVYSINEYNNGVKAYKMALYENNKKVYVFPPRSNEKTLLYDFGVQKGNEFNVAGIIAEFPGAVKIKIIEDGVISIQGAERKALHVKICDSMDYGYDFKSGWWIEGVGSELGPLGNWNFGLSGNHDILISCEINGQIIFEQSDLLQLPDEYQPLVREGVKWIYAYSPKNEDELKCFSVEFSGEAEVNGLRYKQCWRQYLDRNGKPTEDPAELLAYVRENDKRVYAILLSHDSTTHTAPGLAGENPDEWLVYDFNEVSGFYAQMPQYMFYTTGGLIYKGFECNITSPVIIGHSTCPSYTVVEPGFSGVLVEGYGIIGDKHDYLLDPYYKSSDMWSSCVVMTCGMYSIVDNGIEVYHNSDYDSWIETADKYVPLLREGVKWVCLESKFGIYEEEFGTRFYTIEVKGDTVIDGATYKKCYRYSDVDWDEDFVIPCSKTEPYALLREEGRIIYGLDYKVFSCIMEDFSYWDLDYWIAVKTPRLYEFNVNNNFHFEGYRSFLNQQSEEYSFHSKHADGYFDNSYYGKFVEGVGFDSDAYGDLLTPFYYSAFCSCSYRSETGLHHMEDADGNIIYYGRAYTSDPLKGDIDSSGIVDVEDVNAAINIILKLKTISDYPGNGDMDGNGYIDVEDVNAIINIILKINE